MKSQQTAFAKFYVLQILTVLSYGFFNIMCREQLARFENKLRRDTHHFCNINTPLDRKVFSAGV